MEFYLFWESLSTVIFLAFVFFHQAHLIHVSPHFMHLLGVDSCFACFLHELMLHEYPFHFTLLVLPRLQPFLIELLATEQLLSSCEGSTYKYPAKSLSCTGSWAPSAAVPALCTLVRCVYKSTISNTYILFGWRRRLAPSHSSDSVCEGAVTFSLVTTCTTNRDCTLPSWHEKRPT